jgi:2',3'-cyclic-nucleotide 2'-phosphodiesterase/3'-nucleotidase
MTPDSVRRRDVLTAIGGAALVGSAGAGTAAARHRTSVTLLHDTHVHGRYANAFADDLNVERYFGLMNAAEGVPSGVASGSNTLRIGNGDDLASSVLSAAFEGRHVVSAFNAGGLDYDTFGNHDFDMGPETLRQRVGESGFTWVSANAREDGDVFAADAGARRYALETVDGVTLGITGLITPEAPEITSVGEGTEILDPVPATRAVVDEARADGADAVILSSHLGSDTARRVARSVDGIDAIVGDHEASLLEEPAVVDGTLLSFVGDQFASLGELRLNVAADAGVVGHSFTLHDLGEADVRPDPWVGLIVSTYRSRLDERLGVAVGQTTVPLDARESVLRRRESNVGNYVADAIRDDVDADVAIMNGGGIRGDKRYRPDASESDPATVTRETVVSLLPFPNTTVGLTVSGETLLAALENGVSRVADGSGRFPQVSGLSYAYDPSRPAGERLMEATVGGEPVDPDAGYDLATNDFVAGGGDGYAGLTGADRYRPAEEGALLSDLVADRVEAAGTISPETEGRITVVGNG